MANQLEINDLRNSLSTSETFGKQYLEVFERTESSFKYPIHRNIEEMYNNLIGGIETLSKFQEDVLLNIFNEFNNIQHLIDPNRLKPFKYFVNNDSEIILWRKTEEKLINLIIHDTDDIAISCITANDETTSLTYFNLDSDFEALALSFMS